MAEAFPDEDWLFEAAGADEEIEPQIWHDLYFRAFDALRFDRFYGAMGGEGPISYLAISQYARDQEITGDDLSTFQTFIAAIDGEWLKLQSEAAKTKSMTSE